MVGLLQIGISAIMRFGNGGLVKFWAEFLSLLLMYTLFLFLYYSVSSLKIFFVWGSAWCDRFRDYCLHCSLNFELCFYLYCWCTYCSCSFIILFQILKYFFVWGSAWWNRFRDYCLQCSVSRLLDKYLRGL